jgi:hypothetical protein
VDAELSVDVGGLVHDRFGAQAERDSDVFVCAPGGHVVQDLELTRAEITRVSGPAV